MPGQEVDVAAWLRELGLERYAAAFLDAEITPEALPELTDADLRELGLPLGPRKVVLKAIRGLAGPPHSGGGRGGTGGGRAGHRRRSRPRPSGASSRSCSSTWSARPRSRAGSTPRRCARSSAPTRTPSRARSRASRGTSPSSWATACSPTSAGPRAHEDDAERAVRAGLAVVGGVGRLLDAGRRAVGGPGRDRDRAGRGRRPRR